VAKYVIPISRKQPKRIARPGVDRAGRTSLHYAAIAADAIRVKELLESGLNVNAADDEGWTPLHFAAQKSETTTVVRLLLEEGAAVNARDAHGNTPLATAVFNCRGHGDVIKLLRACGADPFAKNAHGVSPVKLARMIANFDVRQFFGDLPDDEEPEPNGSSSSR
jgi:ankyrin repeat protein